jgi:hypothetical protein
MCTPTQSGYNNYWAKLTMPDQTSTRFDMHRKCTCGNKCHRLDAYDKLRTLILTVNTSLYVSEITYAKSKDWQDHASSFKYPKQLTDISTNTTFTHLHSISLYQNNKDHSTYHLTRWRHKYDNNRPKRQSSQTKGGNEIMEKKYVTKKVPQTRKVYGTQKSEGSTHHKWEDNPHDECKYKNYHNYGSTPSEKSSYIQYDSSSDEEVTVNTETYYEDVTETVEVPTGKYTPVVPVYEYPVTLEYKMELHYVGDLEIECKCFKCTPILRELVKKHQGINEDICTMCFHQCHKSAFNCNQNNDLHLCCPCSICYCIQCIEERIGPDNCFRTICGGKEYHQGRIKNFIYNRIPLYKYLYYDYDAGRVTINGKNVYVSRVVSDTVDKSR